MAQFVKFMSQKGEFVEETYKLRNEAEEASEREYQAIIKVQSWFRGVKSRAYIRHLHNSATQIQKQWRAHLGRRHFREVLKQQVMIMELNHYNAMATKIQKMWRGFYTRKYVSNYYSRKRYLEGLKKKNEIVRADLEEYAENQEMLEHIKREKVEKLELDEFVKKNHFLVSTFVKPGVFNNPFLPYPEEKEFHLRTAKKLIAAEMMQRKKTEPKVENPFDPACTQYGARLRDPLPPLAQKPQGPFRDPNMVRKQRYKPFQPSLRVATDFYSLDGARELMKQEEWVTRLNDNIFLPCSRKSEQYEKLLHTTSEYGHPPYGTKYFRHEYPDKWTMAQSFQTVVPPIPVFDKLNDTYSQGQV